MSASSSTIIVTTNLPFEHWTEVLSNERLTGALLDRLTHRLHILEANGDTTRPFSTGQQVSPYSRSARERCCTTKARGPDSLYLRNGHSLVRARVMRW
jgi:hypothetical protein